MIERRVFLEMIGVIPLLSSMGGAVTKTQRTGEWRSLDTFADGDILYWDWDENRIVIKGRASDLWESISKQLGMSLSVLNAKLSFYDDFSFIEVPLLATKYRSSVIIQDVDSGQLLERVISYNEVTRLCVRVATEDGSPRIDLGSGFVGRHYEYRNLSIASESK